MTLKRLVLAAFSAVLLSTGFASAATCNLSYVDNATMCEDGSTNNDKLNPSLQVNVDEIFDYDDWVYIGKEEDNDLDGSYSTGSSYDMYMLVLKGPNPDPYQAYKLDPNTSGSYSLFAFDDQATSHATLYGRGDFSEIPLPAAGFMLIAGLGGLALMRRKR